MSNRTIKIEDIIAAAESGQELTIYQIAKLINDKLEKAGVATIKPQMMYQYDRNGLIVKGVRGRGQNGQGYTLNEAAAFIEKFTAKRIANPKYRAENKTFSFTLEDVKS